MPDAIMPTRSVRCLFNPRATKFTRYPSSEAALMTFSRVSGEILVPGVNALETAERETPALRATSNEVIVDAFELDSAMITPALGSLKMAVNFRIRRKNLETIRAIKIDHIWIVLEAGSKIIPVLSPAKDH